MERDVIYDIGNGMSQKEIEGDKPIEKIEEGSEIELANEVYIFTSSEMTGIKFYDRSPKGSVAKFAGTLPSGTYETDIYSISLVSWDAEINIPNQSQVFRAREGTYTTTTIMVSLEKLMSILYQIEESKDKQHIKINVIENEYKKDTTYNLFELEKMKKELKSQISDSNYNYNDYTNVSVDEIVGKNIK